MNAWRGFLGAIGLTAACVSVFAQTPPPLLGSIEAPYAPLQGSATIAGTTWPAGVTAYGSVGTPLVIYGSNLGGDGFVQFISYYKNSSGTEVAGTPVPATVTLWTSNMLILTVPSGALSGEVFVKVEGQTSNPLPFLVTTNTPYNTGTCPAGPSSTQLQITSTSLPDGQVTKAYNASLYSSGGTGNITWSVASGTLPSGLVLNQPSGSTPATITGTPTASTGTNPPALTFKAVDSASPQHTDEAEITLAVNASSMNQGTVYSYSLSNYDSVGNVTSFNDATYPGSGPGIMGAWSMSAFSGSGNGYDSLYRLSAAKVTWPDGTAQSLCWDYDAFGNRLHQELVSGASGFTNGTGSSCQAASGATLLSLDASPVNGNNQINDGLHQYDPSGAGNLIQDETTGNTYLYDAEGRVCAVESTPAPGFTTMTGYLYDADGDRVAKGTISTMSCNPATNGFQFAEDYVLGPSGEELSILNGSGTWQRTNVYASGGLIGTYDLVSGQPALHFHLEDALGTRRMQVSGMLANLGCPEMDFQSLPYGDQLAEYPDVCYPADDSTPLHFTGKERDTESGNDYFGARYYASSMGRFLSPDPLGSWTADASDPQSWNFYAYGRNNALINVDPDGLDCVYFNNAGNAVESIDRQDSAQNSGTSLSQQSSDCGAAGGDWINGRVTGATYFSDSDTFGFTSYDSSNTYVTYANAPGTEMGGTTCSGNCDIANGYSQTPIDNSWGAQPIAPSAQQFIQNVSQQTAPVNKAFDCAGAAALAWSPIPTPDDASDASDAFLDQGVDAGKELSEAYKNRRVLNAFGSKIKVGKGFRKGAKFAGKGLNVAGKGLAVYGSYKNMQEAGCFSGWSHP